MSTHISENDKREKILTTNPIPHDVSRDSNIGLIN